MTPEETAPDTVLLRLENGIARITLNRPDENNAIDLAVARRLLRIVIELEGDPSCRVVVIDAVGRTFCTGGDVSAIAEHPRPDAYIRDLAETTGEALALLAGSARPVIVAVHGIAAGAGVAFALAADLVLATPTAAFVSAYGAVGLTPDCGVSSRLPQLVGERRAVEFSLTGRAVRAEEARDWGLVTEVVAAERLGARVDELAALLLARSGPAQAETKRLIRSAPISHEARLIDEVEALGRMIGEPETRSLLGAEHERRSARRERLAGRS